MKPARIIGKEVYLVDVPVKQKADSLEGVFPFSVSYGALPGLKRVFLRVDAETEEGKIVSGWGESSPLFFYSNETPKGTYQVLQDYGDYFLRGKTIDYGSLETVRESVEDILDQVTPYCAGQRVNFVQTAIDYALFDLAGKLTSTPVYQILNPEADATVTGQVCWSMSCNDDYFQQEIDAVEQHAKNGYGLKLKLGHNLDANIAATVALLQKYSAEKFPGIKLRVDANSAMSVEQFRAYENGVSAKINPQQLAAVDFYIEEPIDTRAYGRRRDGLRQFAELIKDSQWRIMADETIYTLDDVHDLIGLTEDCTGQLLFNIKVQRLGGLSRAMKVAELAQRHQIPIMVGGMFPASLGKVVNCHYALAVGDFLPSDGLHLSSDYVPEGMSVVRNIDHLEKMDHRKRRDLSVFRGRPGFGAEIDEDLVKNFSFDVGIDGYYPDFVNDNGNNDKRGGS